MTGVVCEFIMEASFTMVSTFRQKTTKFMTASHLRLVLIVGSLYFYQLFFSCGTKLVSYFYSIRSQQNSHLVIKCLADFYLNFEQYKEVRESVYCLSPFGLLSRLTTLLVVYYNIVLHFYIDIVPFPFYGLLYTPLTINIFNSLLKKIK